MKRREAQVQWLTEHQGVPYNTDNRFGPQFYDCSGYTWCGLHYGAGLFMPPTLSWTLAGWVYKDGRELSVPEALRTEGALLFMGANRGLEGWGPKGHVATCWGDGIHILETPSAGHKSGISDARGRNWTGAGLWPGADEEMTAVPGPINLQVDFVKLAIAYRKQAISELQPVIRAAIVLKQGNHGHPVKVVQNAVNLATDAALKVDGDYGPQTAAVILWFQQTFFVGQPWQQDGEAGPNTNRGLAFSLAIRNNRDGG